MTKKILGPGSIYGKAKTKLKELILILQKIRNYRTYVNSFCKSSITAAVAAIRKIPQMG